MNSLQKDNRALIQSFARAKIARLNKCWHLLARASALARHSLSGLQKKKKKKFNYYDTVIVFGLVFSHNLVFD